VELQGSVILIVQIYGTMHSSASDFYQDLMNKFSNEPMTLQQYALDYIISIEDITDQTTETSEQPGTTISSQGTTSNSEDALKGKYLEISTY
jgi:hypothetical protein